MALGIRIREAIGRKIAYYIPDYGDVWVSVNGWALYSYYQFIGYTYNVSTSYSIAADLANTINSTGGYPVTAWAQDWGDNYNATLWLTATSAGASTNYPLSTGSDLLCCNGPDFGATPSGSSLTGGTDNYVFDSGNLWININGNHSISYGQGDSWQSVLNNLANTFASDAYVAASVSGSTLTLTARTAGAATNYSFTAGSSTNRSDLFQPSFAISPTSGALTGGSDNFLDDAGTISININGYSQQANYSQGSTSSSLANALASQFNADSNSPVMASVFGSTIQFVAKAFGSGNNDSVSTSCVTSYPGTFSSASFCWTPTSGSLSGGTNGGSLGSPYITLYTYDALSNLVQVQQKGGDPNSANWRTRAFSYDSLSQLTGAYNPESGTTSYTYDNNGNALTKTTALGSISYCYDSLNRVMAKSYNYSPNSCTSPAATYGYDGIAPQGCSPSLAAANPVGHRTGMCDQSGNEAWSYGAMDRVAGEQRVTNGVTKSTSYGYNFDGSLASLTSPSGRTITYTPSPAARLLSAVDTANNIATQRGRFTPRTETCAR